MFSSIAIVGVGLIGGSIGAAVRKRKLAETVIGIGRNEERLQEAVKLGAIDQATTDMAEGLTGCDLIILCTPVDTIAEQLSLVEKHCTSGAIVTDVGSTKEQIAQAALDVFGSENKSKASFIGSHPLAGGHWAGVSHATADLFVDKDVIVTPQENSPKPHVEKLKDFWNAIGAKVHLMKPAEHDTIVAMTSHGPHLAAAAIAAATSEAALPFAAAGWKDTTRIAAGSPSLWRTIVAANRTNIQENLAVVESKIAEIRAAIERGDDDQLEQLLTEAKRIRDAVGN